MFDMWLQAQLVPDGNVMELTDAVYTPKCRARASTFRKSLKDDYVRMNQYLDAENPDSERYFSMSWADGMDSIIYNERLLNGFIAEHPELGLEAGETPNTTDELLAICEALRADWDAGKPRHLRLGGGRLCLLSVQGRHLHHQPLQYLVGAVRGRG